MAVTGIFFTAAGTRSIFSGMLPRRHVPRQPALIAVLLLAFGFELASGIELLAEPRSAGTGETLGNALAALLVIGIFRPRELAGDRETGIVTSIAVLAGHEPGPDVPPGDHAWRDDESRRRDPGSHRPGDCPG